MLNNPIAYVPRPKVRGNPGDIWLRWELDTADLRPRYVGVKHG